MKWTYFLDFQHIVLYTENGFTIKPDIHKKDSKKVSFYELEEYHKLTKLIITEKKVFYYETHLWGQNPKLSA